MTAEPDEDERLTAALLGEDPYHAVVELAKELRNEGVTQDELRVLYSARFQKEDERGNEIGSDALGIALDLIVGWCSPGKELFPEE